MRLILFLVLLFVFAKAPANQPSATTPIPPRSGGEQSGTSILPMKAGTGVPTTTTIVSHLPTPSVVGERITVVVTANTADGPALGSVLVSDGQGNQCSITLPSNFGCGLTPTGPGDLVISASYQPAAGFLPSNASVHHVVGLPAPSPLPAPDLNFFRGGNVQALVRLPDGGLLVGGQFSHVGGLPRQNLARLHPDGSLNSSWTSGCDGAIRDIAIDSDGSVYVAGFFTECAGSPRRIAAKFQANGQIDPDWVGFDTVQQPGAGGSAVAVDSDGSVYVAGSFFRTLGASQSVGFVKLSGANGVVDSIWPTLPLSYSSVTIDGDSVYLYGVQPSKFDRQTGFPLPFTPPSLSSSNGSFRYVVVDNVGRVLVSGNLVGSFPRNGVVRLQPNGQVDFAWDTALAENVICGRPLIDGDQVLIGCAGPDGRARLLRMRSDGSLDQSYTTEGFGTVATLERFGHGVAVGGALSGWGNQLRAGFAVLGPNGEPLSAPEAEAIGGTVSKVIPSPDGGAIVAGSFSRIGAQRLGSLVKLTSSGELDTSFSATVNGQVFTLALDHAGSLYVGGRFSFANGEQRNNLAKVTSGGSLVPFAAAPDGMVSAIAFLGEDVLIGGSFRTVSQQPRTGLAKLNADGSLNTGWTTVLSSNSAGGQALVAAILATDGGVIVGGLFDAANGQPRVGLVKLDGTGELISNWRNDLGGAGSNTRALTLELGTDQSVYVGGIFRSIGSQPRDNVARLRSNGEVLAWSPTTNNSVQAILVRGSDVFLGGQFSLVNGLGRSGIAQVSAITGAATSFNPSVGGVPTLSRLGPTTLLAGGAFVRAGTALRTGLAGFDIGRGETVFNDGFESP